MNPKYLLSILLLTSTASTVWLALRAGTQGRRIVALEDALKEAQSRKVAVLPEPVRPVEEPPAKVVEQHAARVAAPESVSTAELDGLKVRLLEAAASQAKLQARVSELETEVLNRTGDAARAAALEREARAQSAEATRVAEVAAALKPAADQRIRDLEQELTRVKSQNASAASRKDADMSQVSDELRDIARRQQTLAANILRRYREVTDQFRALPAMLDPAGGPEANRIRTTMSMAEEDVRQLSDLTARMGRLEKRVTTR